MSQIIHIKNATIVNQGEVFRADVLIENEIIKQISQNHQLPTPANATIIDADGLFLLPGIIDDQVHFREPGLTHKADIYTESKAAVAGGVTSYMEMPNTLPPSTSKKLIQEKFDIAAKSSLSNHSFYMGVTNHNIDEVLQTSLHDVCGLKVFLGSSTGNLLVNCEEALDKLFSQTKHIIAVHCEDDQRIEKNLKKAVKTHGESIPFAEHAQIRDVESCYVSSSNAVKLAKKHNAKLHVLHISTEKELSLFDNVLPLKKKKITAEVCVHHLWFCSHDYHKHGAFIKWNPSIKEAHNREALIEAVNLGKIDVIATDHAPHLYEEKQQIYTKAPSGAPIVQFSLQMMLDLVKKNVFSIDNVVKMMCHNPSRLFQIHKRGFIEEGFFADLVLVDTNKPYTVTKDVILSKCNWSPLEGHTFSSSIHTTIINGHIAWQNAKFDETKMGKALTFDR
jgi:dihydroorotase